MLDGGSMVWGFCVYFVYMIPLETDVLRKHRFQKLWSETQVFSSHLRKFPQMIIALDKYTGYMFMSSPNSMMSSSVAMGILCITNIGSICMC